MRVGGIVLCGGKSSRMGRPKAWLPVGGELMLSRVVRILSDVVGPVVVVAAPGQDVPPLPDGVAVVRDEEEDRGPLQGLAAGLAALEGAADAAYLSACDAPLLRPGFVRRLVELLGQPLPPTPSPKKGGGADPVSSGSPPFLGEGLGEGFFACVPSVGGFAQPLAGVYRVSVLPAVRELLAEDRRAVWGLLGKVSTRLVRPAELADVDPRLDSLRNVNHPADYEALLRDVSALQS